MTGLIGIPAALTGSVFALILTGLVFFDAGWRHSAVAPEIAAVLGTVTGISIGGVLIFGPAWLMIRHFRRTQRFEGPFARGLPSLLRDRTADRQLRQSAFAALMAGYALHAGVLVASAGLLAPAWSAWSASSALAAAMVWLAINALLCAFSYAFGR